MKTIFYWSLGITIVLWIGYYALDYFAGSSSDDKIGEAFVSLLPTLSTAITVILFAILVVEKVLA